MLIRLAAALAFLALVVALFRFAMGLRAAKLARAAARAAAEAGGRRVVAEIPLPEGLVLFLEDDSGFYWGDRAVRKRDLVGGRMRLGAGVVASFGGEAGGPADPPPEDAGEGRERWDVVLRLRDGAAAVVPCGGVREGISREAARQVFDAVRRGAEQEAG